MIIRNKGIGITLKNNENITQALRRFKRKVEDSNKLNDLRKKEYYETPSEQRKRARGAAIARYKKRLQKEQQELEEFRKQKQAKF